MYSILEVYRIINTITTTPRITTTHAPIVPPKVLGRVSISDATASKKNSIRIPLDYVIPFYLIRVVYTSHVMLYQILSV